MLTLVLLKLFVGRVLSPFAQASHVDKILVLVRGGFISAGFLTFSAFFLDCTTSNKQRLGTHPCFGISLCSPSCDVFVRIILSTSFEV